MTLDTNILIAYLDGEDVVVNFILEQKELGRIFFISSVSVAELLSLPTLTELDIKRVKHFISSFVVIPMDIGLAESAATIRRCYKLSIPDATIVATSILNQTPLVSRDRGLRKVKELTFIDL